MTSVWRVIWLTVIIVSITSTGLTFMSGTLRSAYLATIERKIAEIWPPDLALVGDSLTENCNWRWELRKPLVVNLAVGGTDIRDIAHQVMQASFLNPDIISIEGGINDVILEEAPIDRISYDFGFLLQRLPASQKAIITLLPFVSTQALNPRIEAVNSIIRGLAEDRRLPTIDLNPRLAPNGVRSPEMTTDGLHLSEKACRVWAEELSAHAASLNAHNHAP